MNSYYCVYLNISNSYNVPHGSAFPHTPCNGLGEKYDAMVIFKEPNGVMGPNVLANLQLPPNVIMAASTSGWMTQSLFHQWLQIVYGTDGEQRNPRRLFIADQYKAHTTEESQRIVNDICNAEVVFRTTWLYTPGAAT